MKVVGSAGGFVGGRFFVVIRVDFRKWFWGLSPPKKRIESRGSGWLGNGWNKKALLDSRPRVKLDFCYTWPVVGLSVDSKASWRRTKRFLRSPTLRDCTA